MRDYSHPIWLSATEGGEGMELGRLSHSPKIVSSEEGEIFTLGMNYSKPWAYDFKDTREGNTSKRLSMYLRLSPCSATP